MPDPRYGAFRCPHELGPVASELASALGVAHGVGRHSPGQSGAVGVPQMYEWTARVDG